MCFICWLETCGHVWACTVDVHVFSNEMHIGHESQSGVQLVGEGDIEGTQLLPWQQLHQGSVAALDICAETRQVLLLSALVWTSTQAFFCLPIRTLCVEIPTEQCHCEADHGERL